MNHVTWLNTLSLCMYVWCNYCSLIMRQLIILWMIVIVMLQHSTGAVEYPDCADCPSDGE